jgi:hypothetical protein
MARCYYLATYDPEHGIEYEPHAYKPTMRSVPEDQPWAIYSSDFYILKRSKDWDATIDHEYARSSPTPTGAPIPRPPDLEY